MNKSYEIGFTHGAAGNGTNGYKPANRKNESFEQYGAGFQAGMAAHHESTAGLRAELAKLNLPKSAR